MSSSDETSQTGRAKGVEERRQQVLATTRDFIAEHGYEQLKMRDLAEACGVSVPTLYRQFGGKQSLVREAVSSHFGDAILSVAGSSGNAAGKPAGEEKGHARLLAVLDAAGADVRRLPGYYRQLMGVFVAESLPGAATTEEKPPDVGAPIQGRLSDSFQLALSEMREAGQLHSWVDIPLTAERIASETMLTGMQWAVGMLSARGYHSALVYSTSMMLLGASRGAAAKAFRARIDATPRSARLRG